MLGFVLTIVAGLAVAIALIFLVRVFLGPKGRRILLSVVSWFGFSITLPGIAFAMFCTVRALFLDGPRSWWTQWEGPGPGDFLIPPLITVYIGTVLMLIGGFIARPRYFWMVCLITGIICILSFYGFLVLNSIWSVEWGLLILTLLPSIACIISSLVMKEQGKADH